LGPRSRANRRLELADVVDIVAVEDHRDFIEIGHYALENSQAFPDEFRRVHRRAGDVCSGPLQTLDHANPDRIEDSQHHDWDGAGCFGGSDRGSDIGGKNQINPSSDKVGHRSVVLAVQDRFAVFDTDVLSLNVSEFHQPLLEDFKALRICILRGHIAHDR